MNELTVIEQSGVAVLDSREVAEWVEVRHADLLEKISGYTTYLTNGKFRSLDFFIPSTYVDAKGEERPNYLITRKGCEMVANKLTGQKGVLFTAAYIERFHAYEAAVQKALSPTDMLELQVKALRQMEQAQAEQQQAIAATNARIDGIKDAIQLNTQSWREECRKLIVRIADARGGREYIRDVHTEVFNLVDTRAGVSLKRRQTMKRQRMAYEGVCKSVRDRVTFVDIIAEDKKLIEIYVAIVKEMAVKYLDAVPA